MQKNITFAQQSQLDRYTCETCLASLDTAVGSATPPTSGFIHISKVLGITLAEVFRRADLRVNLESEGEPLSDEEFVAIAERTGVRI